MDFQLQMFLSIKEKVVYKNSHSFQNQLAFIAQLSTVFPNIAYMFQHTLRHLQLLLLFILASRQCQWFTCILNFFKNILPSNQNNLLKKTA